jgi:FO synthase
MITHAEASALIEGPAAGLPDLLERAGTVRDGGRGRAVTFSAKVFVPLTTLCRDYCGYCTFRRDPGEPGAHTLSPDEVVALVQAGARLGAKEALFSLGDKPEARFAEHREFLRRHGHRTTLSYLRAMCALTLERSSLLPHANPGVMGERDLAALREVNVSMGIMVETVSDRLLGAGMAHDNAPDKVPARRLRDLHERWGHVQEVIVQNFRAKPRIPMRDAPEPTLGDLLRTIAVARLLLGPDVNIQAPPNLTPGVYPKLLAAGLNDWGGVSPLTPDHINPERPWPGLRALREATEREGFDFRERLAIYPEYATRAEFLDERLRPRVAALIDSDGLVRKSHEYWRRW